MKKSTRLILRIVSFGMFLWALGNVLYGFFMIGPITGFNCLVFLDIGRKVRCLISVISLSWCCYLSSLLSKRNERILLIELQDETKKDNSIGYCLFCCIA